VTALRAGQGPIKPGESDTVDVYIDTAGKRGTFAKTVKVSTNDPSKPFIVLQFRATIIPPAGPPGGSQEQK
jgi:hypothetical protein